MIPRIGKGLIPREKSVLTWLKYIGICNIPKTLSVIPPIDGFPS